MGVEEESAICDHCSRQYKVYNIIILSSWLAIKKTLHRRRQKLIVKENPCAEERNKIWDKTTHFLCFECVIQIFEKVFVTKLRQSLNNSYSLICADPDKRWLIHVFGCYP